MVPGPASPPDASQDELALDLRQGSTPRRWRHSRGLRRRGRLPAGSRDRDGRGQRGQPVLLRGHATPPWAAAVATTRALRGDRSTTSSSCRELRRCKRTGAGPSRAAARDDHLIGGGKRDRCWGASGKDRIEGDYGDDRLRGGGGPDESTATAATTTCAATRRAATSPIPAGTRRRRAGRDLRRRAAAPLRALRGLPSRHAPVAAYSPRRRSPTAPPSARSTTPRWPARPCVRA